MDDFLVEIIARVEQQYSDIERECQILRKLLKPWPKKKQVNQETPSHVDKYTDDHLKEENKDLSHSEKQALEEMERILNKAQKAIKIREKAAVATERSNATNSNTNSLNDNEKTIQQSDNTDDNKPSSEKIENESIDKGNKQKAGAHKRAYVPGVQKNPPRVAASEMRPSQQVSTSRLSSSKSTTPRPSSASVSRPSSSRSRYTPAHVTAPFKTDVNTRVPHRKNNHIYKNHLNKAPQKKIASNQIQKQSARLNGLKTLPKIASTMAGNDADCTHQNSNDKETKVIGIENSNSKIQSVPTSDFPEFLAQDTTEDHKQVDESNFKPTMPNHIPDRLPDNLEQPSLKKEELFSLTDKSSKIKVPQRFHKLVSENHTLLEKCTTAKLVKKVPNSDAAFNFVERLNETSEISEELWAKTKSMTCLQSHILMLKSLNSLGIEAISETSSFDKIYRAKKLLEFILSKFSQSQDEADYFSKVHFRQCPLVGMSTPPVDDKDVKDYLFKNQGTHLRKQTDNQFVMDVLKNSKAWARLQFEKNIYELQSHILSLAESEWWQYFTQDPANGGSIQLIHSLLTSNGEFSPAIVENPYS